MRGLVLLRPPSIVVYVIEKLPVLISNEQLFFLLLPRRIQGVALESLAHYELQGGEAASTSRPTHPRLVLPHEGYLS